MAAHPVAARQRRNSAIGSNLPSGLAVHQDLSQGSTSDGSPAQDACPGTSYPVTAARPGILRPAARSATNRRSTRGRPKGAREVGHQERRYAPHEDEQPPGSKLGHGRTSAHQCPLSTAGRFTVHG